MHIIQELREIVMQFAHPATKIADDVLLFDMGINSIDYIKIIVKLEEKYDIEFNDEYLVHDTQTINSIVQFLLDIKATNE